MPHHPRHFRNRLPDFVEPSGLQVPSHDPIAAAASTIPREALLSLFRETADAVQSDLTHSPTIYTGSAGVAYALWHCQRSLRRGCNRHRQPPTPTSTATASGAAATASAPAGPTEDAPTLLPPPPQQQHTASASAATAATGGSGSVEEDKLPGALLAAAVERCRTSAAALRGPKGLGLTHGSRAASMLDGAAGVYLTAALVLHDAAAAAEAGGGGGGTAAALRRERDDYVRSYLDLYPEAMDSENDEYLYGRAGYLQGAQLLNAVLGPGTVAEEVVAGVAEEIWESGSELSGRLRWRLPGSAPPPLFFMWPQRERGEPYLGAAHGMMGILFTLLHVPSLVRQHAQQLRACLGYVAAHERDAPGCSGRGGHYPTRMNVGLTHEADEEAGGGRQGGGSPSKVLVHWCHGSPGAVFMWCKAYQVFGEPPYLAAAERAGEVVWQLGLLRKGHGLCHGTSGNAYALLALHRATRAAAAAAEAAAAAAAAASPSSSSPASPSSSSSSAPSLASSARWLHRARCFAAHIGSGEGRTVYDTPDRPLSLFEGRAGAACLLADLLADDGGSAGARFPAFELP
ncbi:hypothetical protein Agub_g14803 [Astrephomene gubernaculifera]|uniref:Uncharacterized protein n=1 Tax=Astrephomene gubernaculifera TaxID=47775 RepID=A0AAD3E4H1_9CHLO|nr:hypothetical protein Agub_g14803 [Astrephomene gubernaculifera]